MALSSSIRSESFLGSPFRIRDRSVPKNKDKASVSDSTETELLLEFQQQFSAIDAETQQLVEKSLQSTEFRKAQTQADVWLLENIVPKKIEARTERYQDRSKQFLETYNFWKRQKIKLQDLPKFRQFFEQIKMSFSRRYSEEELRVMMSQNDFDTAESVLLRGKEDQETQYYVVVNRFIFLLKSYFLKVSSINEKARSQQLQYDKLKQLKHEIKIQFEQQFLESLKPFFASEIDDKMITVGNVAYHLVAFCNAKAGNEGAIEGLTISQIQSEYAKIMLELATRGKKDFFNEPYAQKFAYSRANLSAIPNAEVFFSVLSTEYRWYSEAYLGALPEEERAKIRQSKNPYLRTILQDFENNPQIFAEGLLPAAEVRIYTLWRNTYGTDFPYNARELLTGKTILNEAIQADKKQKKENEITRKRLLDFSAANNITKEELFAVNNYRSLDKNPAFEKTKRDIDLAAVFELLYGTEQNQLIALEHFFPHTDNDILDLASPFPEFENKNGYAILSELIRTTENARLRKRIGALWSRGKDWGKLPFKKQGEQLSDDEVIFMMFGGMNADGQEVNAQSFTAENIAAARTRFQEYISYTRAPAEKHSSPFSIQVIGKVRVLEKMYSGDSFKERLEKLEKISPKFFQMVAQSTDVNEVKWASYLFAGMNSPLRGERIAADLEKTLQVIEGKPHVLKLFKDDIIWDWIENRTEKFSELLQAIEIVPDSAYESELARSAIEFGYLKITDLPFTVELFKAYVNVFKGWPKDEVSVFLDNLFKANQIRYENVEQIKQVENYLSAYGLIYLVELFQVHRDLRASLPLTANVQEVGVTKTGNEGLQQLSEFYRRITNAYIENGNVEEILRHIKNPLVLDIFAHMTRFNTSQWSRKGLDLSQIISSFSAEQKKKKKLAEVPSYYEKSVLAVKPLKEKEEFSITQDAKDKYSSYISDLQWAVGVKPENLQSVLDDLKREIESLIHETVRAIDESTKIPEKVRIQQRGAFAGETDGNNGLLAEIREAKDAHALIKVIVSFTDKQSFTRKNLLATAQFRRLMMLEATKINRSYAEDVLNGSVSEINLTTEHLSAISGFIQSGILDEVVKIAQLQKAKSLEFIRDKALGVQIFQDEVARSTVQDGGTEEVEVYPSRDLRMELSGFSADACWTRKKNIVAEYPDLVGLTYAKKINEVRSIIGSCLIIEGVLKNGDDAFIIRGINPRENYIRKMSSESFFEEQVRLAETWIRKKVENEKKAGVKNKQLRKIHIVAPPADSGALTNRGPIMGYFDKTYGNKPQVTFNKPVNFNGYDITNTCRIVKTIEVA